MGYDDIGAKSCKRRVCVENIADKGLNVEGLGGAGALGGALVHSPKMGL